MSNQSAEQWRAKDNKDSQRCWWIQLWLDGFSHFHWSSQSCATPAGLQGCQGLRLPHKAQWRLQEHSKLNQLFFREVPELRGSALSYPLLHYQSNTCKSAELKLLPRQRKKTLSSEVDMILFTNSFCSAMKGIDPAASLICKLSLMKLLELLKEEHMNQVYWQFCHIDLTRNKFRSLLIQMKQQNLHINT